jgi:putative DNA methylase
MAAFLKKTLKRQHISQTIRSSLPTRLTTTTCAYADLSDFFYVWLREALRPIYPSVVRNDGRTQSRRAGGRSYRHGGKDAAEAFFLDGMTQAMHNLANRLIRPFPVTIYYAFKQSETKRRWHIITGWETFLEAVFGWICLTGTWPMRTELGVA